MTPARNQASTPLRPLPWWRALVGLCCLLAVGIGAPAQPLLPFSLARTAASLQGEGEERAPLPQDDDHLDEPSKDAARHHGDRLDRKRLARRVSLLRLAWRAHLPHPHTATAGYMPVPATPFQRGAPLSLRC